MPNRGHTLLHPFDDCAPGRIELAQRHNMHWTLKAQIQKVCATMPHGDYVYQKIQRRFGGLNADPFNRLPRHADMVRSLAALGFSFEGARCLEVGSGHLPIAPVACYLVGASEVVTVDLHNRLALDLTGAMLHRLAAAEAAVLDLYDGLVDASLIRKRMRLVRSLATQPLKFLEASGIRYIAPCDAAKMPAADGSVDLHYSITVLEHIETPLLPGILIEAGRLLKSRGIAAHLVDPSDHFAHGDPTISRINFLRFTERDWQRVAGNQFAYCNRLRAPEFEALFDRCGFDIERCDRVVDDRSMRELAAGFPLDSSFQRFTETDVCTTTLSLYARPRNAP